MFVDSSIRVAKRVCEGAVLAQTTCLTKWNDLTPRVLVIRTPVVCFLTKKQLRTGHTGPAEAAHIGRGAPFYTLGIPYCTFVFSLDRPPCFSCILLRRVSTGGIRSGRKAAHRHHELDRAAGSATPTGPIGKPERSVGVEGWAESLIFLRGRKLSLIHI